TRFSRDWSSDVCSSDLDEQGQPLEPQPATIILPVGSHYLQHAAHPISVDYTYFDHFEPSMNTMRQMALLCLLDPDIVLQTVRLRSEERRVGKECRGRR